MRLPMNRWRNRPGAVLTCAVAAAVVAGLTACGNGQQGDGETFDAIKARLESASSAREYDTVGEAVAMTAAGNRWPPALAVVRGGVTAVQPGVSMSWELTDDGAEKTILPFGDEAAEISTYHLILEVDDIIARGPGAELGSTLTLGIALPPDSVNLDQVRADFEQVDDAVFFVADTPVFDYEPGILGISENGTLIGFVNDGAVTYPLLEGPDSFTADARSLAELEAAARG